MQGRAYHIEQENEKVGGDGPSAGAGAKKNTDEVCNGAHCNAALGAGP